MEDFKTIYCITSNWSSDSICRIGITDVHEGKILSSARIIVKPQPFFIDSYNANKYGLTEDELNEGILWSDAYCKIANILGSDNLVTHFVPHQSKIIHAACAANSIISPKLNYYDTMHLCKVCGDSFSKYSIQKVSKQLNIPIDLSEITSMSEAVALILLHYAEKYNSNSVRQLYNKVPVLDNGFYRESIFIDDEPIFDLSDYFAGKSFCITGTLELCKRDDAYRIIEESGGIVAKGVTKNTDVLVVGLHEYFDDNGSRSSKYQKALELQAKGAPIQIISEQDFRELIQKKK